MARINNSEVTRRIIDDAKIQLVVDQAPTELGKTVVPVLIANPRETPNIFAVASNSVTTSLTVMTTLAGKDFYLTGGCVSYMKDATADNVEIIVEVFRNGVAINLYRIVSISLTAHEHSENLIFPHPIKLDRGSTIKIYGAFTVGALTKSLAINGYYLED